MFLFSGRAGADGIPGKDGRDGTPGCTTNLKLFSKLNTKNMEYFAEIKSIEITLNESTTFPTEIFRNCLHLLSSVLFRIRNCATYRTVYWIVFLLLL